MAKRSKIDKTTIVDIAAASGVSVSTVSRILNNRPDVAEDTRQRVLRVIEEMGFAPQTAWQQLRSGKSRTIALHYPQDFNPPAQSIVTGAAFGCENAGYSLKLIVNSLSDTDLLNLFRTGQIDGIILMEVLTHDQRVEFLRSQGYPFVMVGRCIDNTGLSYVDIDIGGGVVNAISHLVELGHRQIGFVTLSPILQEKEYGYTTWAVKGYERACQIFRLPVLWRAVDLNTLSVTETVQDLLTNNPSITALVTPQDRGVPGILRAASALGLRIPEDLSVVGVLDETLSDLTSPPITSINFPSRRLGAEAARILIDHLIRPTDRVEQILLQPELILRGSTGQVRPVRENP